MFTLINVHNNYLNNSQDGATNETKQLRLKLLPTYLFCIWMWKLFDYWGCTPSCVFLAPNLFTTTRWLFPHFQSHVSRNKLGTWLIFLCQWKKQDYSLSMKEGSLFCFIVMRSTKSDASDCVLSVWKALWRGGVEGWIFKKPSLLLC
jgi:hypothetical protein